MIGIPYEVKKLKTSTLKLGVYNGAIVFEIVNERSSEGISGDVGLDGFYVLTNYDPHTEVGSLFEFMEALLIVEDARLKLPGAKPSEHPLALMIRGQSQSKGDCNGWRIVLASWGRPASADASGSRREAGSRAVAEACAFGCGARAALVGIGENRLLPSYDF